MQRFTHMIETRPVRIHVSDEILRDRQNHDYPVDCARVHIQSLTRGTFLRSEYLKTHDIQTIDILLAHGEYTKAWTFSDDPPHSRRVQDWVTTVDDPRTLVLVAVCNPFAKDITSTYAHMVYPLTIYSPALRTTGECPVKVYTPGLGHIKVN